ncbi:M28 family peptidase [Tundrisphaera sp. TA3]|uniref:M28 family peptidase n=1 Tax=Tundrisphaera sp. TA3 TaxID=3435775 RepID=UPI003EB7591D
MRRTGRLRSGAAAALALLAVAGPRAAVAQGAPPAPLPPARSAALDRISADSLKGHLSFLSSDLLEGRDTPSRGLDLAAEYIAAQFRRAGLEPIGDDGYFQTARWEIEESDPSSFVLQVGTDADRARVREDRISQARFAGVDLKGAPLVKVDFAAAAALKPEEVAGKVVLVEMPDPRRIDRDKRGPTIRAIGEFQAKMAAAGAAFILNVGRDAEAATGLGPGRLIDPQSPPPVPPGGAVPSATVHDNDVSRLFDAMPAGPAPEAATATIRLAPTTRRPVVIRNVVGLLRGSDPAMKETYVMVTAHYDHVGVRGPAGTDRIYNGANDDGSGTVSVIEIASALATLKERPKRSLVFVTFFGEEKGLLGSRYYGRNPVVPVDKTVADVNLEQVGRTDSSEGPQVATASLTGFGFSEVSTILADAGQAEGIRVYKHPTNSDAYFGASDNQALADLGVPAHTLCVAYQYADYHGPADHWDKIDYANMARIDRMVARALLAIADDPDEPKWDASNPKAAKYLKAWQDRRGR